MERRIIFLLLLCICARFVYAQKVGVVLSGGGAWGLAHIGVLKELEKNNIPIDFIAGTSMGALIGGLYASGYSPDELEMIVTHPEFSSLVTGRQTSEQIYYFKVPEPTASIINIKLNLDSGQLRTSIPTALVSAYNYDFKLLELMAGPIQVANYNFDSLFVPFRCVGADIRKKSPVVFKDGYLPSAVRVSATYPLYMRPLKVNGNVMFDGGLYNNFPADVILEDFYPDLIIGSNVLGPGGTSELSEDDLIGQIKAMVMSPTNYEPICENMIIITPTLTTSLFDFTNNKRTIEVGEEATREKLDSIKLFTPRYVNREEVEAKRQNFKSKLPELEFDEIYVTGVKKLQKSYIQKLLTKPYKHNLGLKELRKEYFQLVADERIKDVYPMALYNYQKKKYNLYLKTKVDQSLEVSFGGNLSTKPYNTAFVGVKFKRLWTNALTLNANGFFGRVYNSAHFDARLDVPNKIPFSFNVFYNFNQYNYTKNFNFFIETKKRLVSVNQAEHTAGFDFGFAAGRQGRVKSGGAFVYLENYYYQTPWFNTGDTADKTLFRVGTAHLTYELNTLNRKQYASQGAYLHASIRFMHAIEEYVPGSTSVLNPFNRQFLNWFQFRIAGEKFFFKYKKIRASLNGELFYSMQPVLGNYQNSLIMSRQYYAVPEMANMFLPEYRSTEYIAGGGRLVYTPIKNLDIRADVQVFQPFRELKRTPTGEAYRSLTWFYRTYFITSLAAVYFTPVGPVSLTYNYYHHTERPHSVYFNVGFIIHNKRALE